MGVIYEIIGNVPELSSWVFIALCVVSFFTSLISAAFGLGGGVMLVTIMALLLNPLAVIPIHAVIQMNSNLFRAIMMWSHLKSIVFAIPKYLLQSIIGLFITLGPLHQGY